MPDNEGLTEEPIDEINPDPEHESNDIHVGDFDPEKIGEVARKTFRFSDKLKGITHRTAKVLVFLNGETLDNFAEANKAATRISDQIGLLTKFQKTDPDYIQKLEALTAEHDRLDALAQPFRDEMFKEAAVIHLKGYPNIAVKAARRAARKKFLDDETKTVRPEREQEAQEYMDFLLLGQSIVKIVMSDGSEDDLKSYVDEETGLTIHPRDTIGEQLSNDLPPSQWKRVQDAFATVTLTDQISQAVTDDPGF